jgi:anti-sigma regulatory factor (Ser/Thr protein kinase)
MSNQGTTPATSEPEWRHTAAARGSSAYTQSHDPCAAIGPRPSPLLARDSSSAVAPHSVGQQSPPCHRAAKEWSWQEGRYVSVELAPEPASAAIARRVARDALAAWGLEHVSDDAQLIISELSSNAIAASVPAVRSRPAIIVAIHHVPPEIRIYAWDNGPGKPEPSDPGNDSVTGRGLGIIDALTHSEWDWWPTPESGGKVVTASLPIAPRGSA